MFFFRFQCDILKNLILGCFEILFAKPFFLSELSTTWLISLSGQVSQYLFGGNWILAFSRRFEQSLIKILGFGFFAHTFSKMFSVPVEEEVARFTLGPNFAENTAFQLDLSVS